jgi:hypothetical protein
MTVVSLAHTTRRGTRLLAKCNSSLLTQAQAILRHLDLTEDATGKFRHGSKVGLGWSVATMQRDAGGLRVEEPDFDSDPVTNTRDDISVSLTVLGGQQYVQQLARKSAVPAPFYSKIIVGGDALLHDRVYLQRSAVADPLDSGWYIGPIADDVPSQPYVGLRSFDLLRGRPELLQALALPVGWVVLFDAKRLTKIVDAEDRIIFEEGIQPA